MDRVISEPCYKGIILYRNYRKMTIWEPRPGRYNQNRVITSSVIKGLKCTPQLTATLESCDFGQKHVASLVLPI